MNLPTAWLVDVDGTFALHQHRNPYDWRMADSDLPNMSVITAVQALAAHSGVSAIIAISGRYEQARELTTRWLEAQGVPYNELFLRSDGDDRADDVVKRNCFARGSKPATRSRASSTIGTE